MSMAIENYYGCPILNFDEISEWEEFKNNLYPNSLISDVDLVQIYVEDCNSKNINEILKSYPDRRTVFEILNLTPIFKNLYIDEPSVFFSCFIDDIAKFIDDMMTNGYYNIVMEDGVSTIKTLDANLKLLRWAKRISDARFYSRPLSPLEKFLTAYKYVTRYVYHETETKYRMNSRRVSSILNNKGKDIVCVGYSALLAELCKKIGIPCAIQFLLPTKKEEMGHAIAMVYLKDEKYDVHGIYFSDPCFDSRNEKKAAKHLYCMMTLDRTIETYMKHGFVLKKTEETFKALTKFPELISSLETYISKTSKEEVCDMNITKDDFGILANNEYDMRNVIRADTAVNILLHPTLSIKKNFERAWSEFFVDKGGKPPM